MKKVLGLILILIFVSAPTVKADDKAKGGVQRVDFGETDINGKVRSPEGAYLVQKKGVDFVPMYKVKKKLSDGVKESLEYIH